MRSGGEKKERERREKKGEGGISHLVNDSPFERADESGSGWRVSRMWRDRK